MRRYPLYLQKTLQQENNRINLQSGLWKPNLPLQRLHYGTNTIKNHLLSCLPSSSSKAFIISGNSLTTKMPLIEKVEKLLGKTHDSGTFAKLG